MSVYGQELGMTEESASASASASRRSLIWDNHRLRQQLVKAEALAARHVVMLSEGDHRIKNSLQIVASLMNVQARHEVSAPARAALMAAVARIQSVARIHDALQASLGADAIELGEILTKVCHTLHEMAGDTDRIAVSVNVETVRAPVALAQPLVLAVNELVLNALRHAFPDERTGAIEVTLARVGSDVRIVVADNGRGLPADYAGGTGYGMQLVRMMTTQVGGVLDVQNTAGARFTLTAPAGS